MVDNTTYISTAKTEHTNVEFAGVAPNTGATVTPPGNATTWSHTSAEAARASGAITQAQYVSVRLYLTNHEQETCSQARDTNNLSGTYLRNS
jgi:hypothetical protein